MRSNSDFQRAIDLQERGEFDAAIEIYDELLEIERLPICLLARGVAEQQRGKPKQAILFLEEARDKAPELLEVRVSLADLLMQRQDYKLAIIELQQATQLQPSSVSAWERLAKCQTRLKQYREAISSWKSLLALGHQALPVWRKLAYCFEQLGDFQSAEATWRQCLMRHSASSVVFNELGANLRTQGRLQEAVSVFDTATRLNVSDVAAWSNLGATLHELKEYERSEQALRQAIRADETYAGAHFNLGNLLKDKDDLKAASTSYERAIELCPSSCDFRINYVTTLNSLGKFEESASQCREILKRDPGFTSAYYNLFTFNSEKVTEEEVAKLSELLKQDRVSSEEKTSICFSLAKRSEKMGHYEEAFRFYQQANYSSPRHSQFRYDDLRANVDRFIETFSDLPANFWQRQGTDSLQPIFVLGLPRSGSTLVDQILTSHSQVSGAGEFSGIRHLIVNFFNRKTDGNSGKENNYPYCLREITSSYLQDLSSVYLDGLRRVAGDWPRITDKMPNNAFQLGLINLLFPQATIIYTRRDLRDVGLSCFFQNFTQYHEFSYDLKNIGLFLREHCRLMDFWRETLPIKIHDVVYEDLVADQERETRRLIVDYCGLPWDDRCLDFQSNDRPVHTASLWQVRQPLYSGSVSKWKKYEQYLGPMTELLEGLVDAPSEQSHQSH